MAGQVLNFGPRRVVSIQWLAELLKRDWKTVRRALQDLEPDGEIKGKPAWLPENALPHIVLKLEGADVEVRRGLDDFEPRERKEWVQSERELNKLRAEAKELIPRDEVHTEMSSLVKSFVRALDTLGDVLEREAGISGHQVAIVNEVCDRVRGELYQAAEADDVSDDDASNGRT